MNLTEVFTRPLNEKNGKLKVSVPFIAYAIYFAIYFSLYVFMMVAFGMNSDELAISGMIIFYALVFALEIPIYLIVYFYYYEYLQAGLEDRETIAIWKTPWLDTIKKSAKYFLAYLAHSLIMFIPMLLVIGIIAILSILGSDSFEFVAIMVACTLGLLTFVWAIWYACYVYTPCLVHMVKTNTFANAFKFTEAREFLEKGNGRFTKFLLINLGIIVVFYAFYFLFAFLSIILIGIPFLILTLALLMYYGMIVFPMYLGTTVREIETSK